MIVYPPWSVLCGDCGRTHAAGTPCPCFWLALFLRQNNDDLDEWQAELDREAAEIENLTSEEYEQFKEYVQHLWSRNLTDKAVDMFIREWLAADDQFRRAVRPRHDVAGALAARNGALAALPAAPGSPAYRNVIGRLSGAGYRVVVLGRDHLGRDHVKAQCPTHDDHEPSLYVTRGRDRALIHCVVGCDTRDVVAALGLEMSDLFDNSYPDPSLDGEIKVTKVVRRGRRRKIRQRS